MGKIKTGIKMVVNPEQSRKVQEICFENGIGCMTGTSIKHLDAPFLFIDDYLSFMYGEEDEYFLGEGSEEVSAELFIRTNGTCVESETLTENNNKGEQMEELKLECLVEGYEGTYFEIGQVWQIKSGDRLKVKEFDFETDIYKLTMTEVDDSTPKYYYTPKGEELQGEESELDLVKLISTEATPSKESQQKTQSEFISTEEFDQMFEQKATTKYIVFVEGRSNPKKIHYSYDSAEKEAKRLSAKEIGCNVMVLSVVKTFKSKVIVEEV